CAQMSVEREPGLEVGRRTPSTPPLFVDQPRRAAKCFDVKRLDHRRKAFELDEGLRRKQRKRPDTLVRRDGEKPFNHLAPRSAQVHAPAAVQDLTVTQGGGAETKHTGSHR